MGSHPGVGQGDEQTQGAGVAAVDVLVVWLVEVGQQTLVAARFADAAAVFALDFQLRQRFHRPGAAGITVVHQLQRLCRHLRQRIGLRGQAREYTGAAFCRFVEQQGLAVVLGGQGLGNQLGLFDLEHQLDATLERSLQRGHGRGFERLDGGQDQDVAVVFHERDDGLTGNLVEQFFCGFRRVVTAARFVLPAPLAGDGVDVEAQLFLVLASAPAAVDAPDLRGGGVLEAGQR